MRGCGTHGFPSQQARRRGGKPRGPTPPRRIPLQLPFLPQFLLPLHSRGSDLKRGVGSRSRVRLLGAPHYTNVVYATVQRSIGRGQERKGVGGVLGERGGPYEGQNQGTVMSPSLRVLHRPPQSPLHSPCVLLLSSRRKTVFSTQRTPQHDLGPAQTPGYTVGC